MGIDGGVQEVIAAHGVAVLVLLAAALVGSAVTASGGAAEFAPATAGRDLAEFLDVDMHQLTRLISGNTADHAPGRTVQPAQTSQAVAGQHPVHSGRVQTE
ncbi:hypothetical protein GOAMI_64_00010 [Gordonia amicalis NBRC 100051 = JCM 11271]|nr:hypothetical protein GOAMI_64_00010 [Gordonia amicalis NBRC 100051 = JCM 11271]